jgi:hypothetical protein
MKQFIKTSFSYGSNLDEKTMDFELMSQLKKNLDVEMGTEFILYIRGTGTFLPECAMV